MRLEIDGGGYIQACDALYSGNQDVCSTMLDLAGIVDGGNAMAGGDTCGQAWAEQYDPAAAKALAAGEDLADAFAKLANLTNASLVNHKAADGGAQLSGSPYSSEDSGDHNPDHWTSSIGLGTPPSAYGGTGDEPSWWHWIAGHLGGWFWPDADTGKLRAVGAGWQKAADSLTTNAAWADSAADGLSIERSPEISTAVGVLKTLKSHGTDLASAFHDLGQACINYADDVDAKHEEIEHELKSFVEWTIGIEAGGAILGALTLGIGEGAAQVAEGAKVAQAASKVIEILTKLLELAKAAAAAVGAVLARIGEIVANVGRFLTGTREVAAVERAGAEAADAAKAVRTGHLPEHGTPNTFGYDAAGDRLPYANSRPSYGDDQVEQVWNRAKDADGEVWVLDKNGDPVKVDWQPGQPRRDVWDMGHVPGQEYRTMREEYLSGQISKEEFLKWYRDPDNYVVENPGRNRSGIDEAIPRGH